MVGVRGSRRGQPPAAACMGGGNRKRSAWGGCNMGCPLLRRRLCRSPAIQARPSGLPRTRCCPQAPSSGLGRGGSCDHRVCVKPRIRIWAAWSSLKLWSLRAGRLRDLGPPLGDPAAGGAAGGVHSQHKLKAVRIEIIADRSRAGRRRWPSGMKTFASPGTVRRLVPSSMGQLALPRLRSVGGSRCLPPQLRIGTHRMGFDP